MCVREFKVACQVLIFTSSQGIDVGAAVALAQNGSAENLSSSAVSSAVATTTSCDNFTQSNKATLSNSTTGSPNQSDKQPPIPGIGTESSAEKTSAEPEETHSTCPVCSKSRLCVGIALAVDNIILTNPSHRLSNLYTHDPDFTDSVCRCKLWPVSREPFDSDPPAGDLLLTLGTYFSKNCGTRKRQLASHNKGMCDDCYGLVCSDAIRMKVWRAHHADNSQEPSPTADELTPAQCLPEVLKMLESANLEPAELEMLSMMAHNASAKHPCQRRYPASAAEQVQLILHNKSAYCLRTLHANFPSAFMSESTVRRHLSDAIEGAYPMKIPGLQQDIVQHIKPLFIKHGWVTDKGKCGPLLECFDAIAIREIAQPVQLTQQHQNGEVMYYGFVGTWNTKTGEWDCTKMVSSLEDLHAKIKGDILASNCLVGLYTAPCPNSPRVIAFMVGVGKSYTLDDLNSWMSILQDGWKEHDVPIITVSADHISMHMSFFKQLATVSPRPSDPEWLKQVQELLFSRPEWIAKIGIGAHGYPIAPLPDTGHLLGLAHQCNLNPFKSIIAPNGYFHLDHYRAIVDHLKNPESQGEYSNIGITENCCKDWGIPRGDQSTKIASSQYTRRKGL